MYLEESIRRIVKDIDPRFDCHFERGGYQITQTSPLGKTAPYAFLPYDGVTKEFFDNMRRNIYIARNGDPMRDMLEHNAELERRRAEHDDAETDYLVKNTAPRMYRALQEV